MLDSMNITGRAQATFAGLDQAAHTCVTSAPGFELVQAIVDSINRRGVGDFQLEISVSRHQTASPATGLMNGLRRGGEEAVVRRKKARGAGSCDFPAGGGRSPFRGEGGRLGRGL